MRQVFLDAALPVEKPWSPAVLAALTNVDFPAGKDELVRTAGLRRPRSLPCARCAIPPAALPTAAIEVAGAPPVPAATTTRLRRQTPRAAGLAGSTAEMLGGVITEYYQAA